VEVLGVGDHHAPLDAEHDLGGLEGADAGEALLVEGAIAGLVQLCRCRDRSTYADSGTIPTPGRRTG